jgi:hypothetical protein
MHPADFQKVMGQLKAKAPRVMAQMAHYHRNNDNLP